MRNFAPIYVQIMRFTLRGILVYTVCITLALSCGSARKTTSVATSTRPKPKLAVPKLPEQQAVGGKFTPSVNDVYLFNLLKDQNSLAQIIQDPAKYRLQIIYTVIDRDAVNQPKFTTYTFRTHAGEYFYPAQTVMLPTALSALHKLTNLKTEGLTEQTTMIVDAGADWQVPAYNDPTSADGRPTMGGFVRQALSNGSDAAANSLYAFTTQQYLNELLEAQGFDSTYIVERNGVFNSADENAKSNPVYFINNGGQKIYSQPMIFNRVKWPARNDFAGKAYYSNGKLIQAPMMFSYKNKLSLAALQRSLQNVIFPGGSSLPYFNISDAQRNIVLQSMYNNSSVISDAATAKSASIAINPLYTGVVNLPGVNNIITYGTGGAGYGQYTCTSYFADAAKGVEFLLGATIYCNPDDIINNSTYNYTTFGSRFFKDLATVFYTKELQRRKEYLPNFSSVNINN